MSFQSYFTRRHIPTYTRADIKWWSTYARSWNGTQILKTKQPTMKIYTDASGSKGLGGMFEDHWFSTRCPCRLFLMAQPHIINLINIQDWPKILYGFHHHAPPIPQLRQIKSTSITDSDTRMGWMAWQDKRAATQNH